MSGRLPPGFIQDLIARTDIVALIGKSVELKKAGKEHRGLSPFTDERSPSFFVNPAKQKFFCFSSGKQGNAITFLMEHDRMSFIEAVRCLAAAAGVEVPTPSAMTERARTTAGPLDALKIATNFYRDQLRAHPAAIEYLKGRGLHGETAKLYGIGFAPDAWDALTPLFPEANEQQQHALDAGLLVQRDRGGCYDRFRNRIMFPIRDAQGRTIGFGGRTIGHDPSKYLNSPETALFHKGRNLYGLYEAAQAVQGELHSLIVVEGYMDVVMLAQHGIRNVVAALGTATTREHAALLFRSTRRVVFCFDGDRAGRAAARRALDQVLPELLPGRECRFAFLPDGHDPDSLVQDAGADAFRSVIEHAQTLSDYLLSELARQTDLTTIEGRAQLLSSAQPYIERINDAPLQAVILEELARLAHLRRNDLDAALRVNANSTPAPAGWETATVSLPPELMQQVRALEQQARAGLAQRDEQTLSSPRAA